MNLLVYTDPGSCETIRSTSIEGEAWFVASDICRILQLTNPTKAVKCLAEQEKMTASSDAFDSAKKLESFATRGGARKLVLVNKRAFSSYKSWFFL